MPKVGKKHYPYTHAGRRAAKEAAKKQGLKVEYTESTYENISKLMFEVTKKEAEDIARGIRAKHTPDNATDSDKAGATAQALQYLMNVKIEDKPKTPGAKKTPSRIQRRSEARARGRGIATAKHKEDMRKLKDK